MMIHTQVPHPLALYGPSPASHPCSPQDWSITLLLQVLLRPRSTYPIGPSLNRPPAPTLAQHLDTKWNASSSGGQAMAALLQAGVYRVPFTSHLHSGEQKGVAAISCLDSLS